jgi:hypothetical protein
MMSLLPKALRQLGHDAHCDMQVRLCSAPQHIVRVVSMLDPCKSNTADHFHRAKRRDESDLRSATRTLAICLAVTFRASFNRFCDLFIIYSLERFYYQEHKSINSSC